MLARKADAEHIEPEIRESKLMDQLVSLIQDEEKCRTMGENILKLAQPDAIDLIIKEILSN